MPTPLNVARPLAIAALLLAVGSAVTGCPPQIDATTVVVYCSMDEGPARQLFDAFTEKTGITVTPRFDTEAEKNLGPVNWLIGERGAPRADVFLNGEISATARLKTEGVLEAYASPAASEGDRPAWCHDADSVYTVFALRARVLVYDPDELDADELPTDLADLPNLGIERFGRRIAISNPQTGSHAAQVAAMVQAWGEERTRKWYQNMLALDPLRKPGNMDVVQAVARGEALLGLTDTDDVFSANQEGLDVAFAVPANTVIFGATAALVKGAPHTDNAKKLIDFLLSKQAERILAESRARFMPTRDDVTPPDGWPARDSLTPLGVDWSKIEPARAKAESLIRELFET